MVVVVTLGGAACGGASEGSGDTGSASATTDAAAETVDGDTGRMSQGEFDRLTQYDEKFASELQDWSSGYATCSQIGLAGDLAGFRDCIKEAWDGVEGAGLLAYDNATDTFDDVGNTCLAKLRAYSKRVDQVYSANLAAHDDARALDFDAITLDFKRLPRLAKRYAAASLSVRDACNPS
jgi:hypothetical protein